MFDITNWREWTRQDLKYTVIYWNIPYYKSDQLHNDISKCYSKYCYSDSRDISVYCSKAAYRPSVHTMILCPIVLYIWVFWKVDKVGNLKKIFWKEESECEFIVWGPWVFHMCDTSWVSDKRAEKRVPWWDVQFCQLDPKLLEIAWNE